MKYLTLPFLLLSALLILSACSLIGGEDDPPEPLFEPGEYGGEPLPGTEALYNLKLSPDGSQVALIREKTPDETTDPRNQLWIVDRNGSNPKLIGVNTRSVDWSPDGMKLAVTVTLGISAYIYTIDLETLNTQQWTGREDQFFSEPTVSNPIWFQDGKRLLVSVMAKAYQQPFERGIYTINTETGDINGPLVELMQAAFLGKNDEYAIGRKYTYDHVPLDGNYARYDFATGDWTWVTNFPKDSLDFVHVPVASPTSELLVQGRRINNAEQLFLMDKDGENVRQITTLGGDFGLWTYDGQQIFFRRDVHKGEGARYIPFLYDLTTEEAAPLWPSRPDSLPVFPDLATQTIHSPR